MEPSRPTPLDLALSERAERQLGLLRRSDLEELGVGSEARKSRRRRHVLHDVHPGAYALGHRAITREADYLAAAFWCGSGTALGLQSATIRKGWLFEDPDRLGPVHLVTLRDRSSRAGVRVHRTRRLQLADVDRFGDLWVTTDARTLIDLADVLTYPEVRGVADRLQNLPVEAIRAAQARVPGRRGAPKVARLLDETDAHTRSQLGRRSVAYFAHHVVPAPRRNEKVHGIQVDCWFPEAPLAVELDSRKHHRSEREMQLDRQRDRALMRHGVGTMRLMWRDLSLDDPRAAQDILKQLGRGHGSARHHAA